MHSLSDYEVISSLPDSENSFKVKDKVNGGSKALHVVEYKDLGDFHTQSLLSKLFNLAKNQQHRHHTKIIQHFIKKDSLSIYIVMELVDGEHLSHFIKKCREESMQFEESYIWRVLAQLHSAIKIMTSGSLTLNNVFIDKKGDMKWNAAISDSSTVPLNSQLGYLATEMCTAGESTYIPSFYSKKLKDTISSLVLGEEVTFKATLNKGYPKLSPRIPNKTFCSDDTAALRNELFGTLNSKIKSNPNIYESVIYADATICSNEVSSPNTLSSNVFEDVLKSRLHAIRAQEALLRQKESNLIRKEKDLFEREKRIAEAEKRIKEKEVPPPAPRRPPKKKLLDDTYCTKELNDTARTPTVAKMKIPPLPPRIRSLQQQKKVTFKSPKKFIKYDIENIPELKTFTSRTSISSKSSDDDNHTKRKSILSVLGIHSQKPNRAPGRPKSMCEVNEVKASDIEQKWTLENKKAAFEMLAAMTAKNVGTEKLPTKNFHRNNNRRSCYVPRTCL